MISVSQAQIWMGIRVSSSSVMKVYTSFVFCILFLCFFRMSSKQTWRRTSCYWLLFRAFARILTYVVVVVVVHCISLMTLKLHSKTCKWMLCVAVQRHTLDTIKLQSTCTMLMHKRTPEIKRLQHTFSSVVAAIKRLSSLFLSIAMYVYVNVCLFMYVFYCWLYVSFYFGFFFLHRHFGGVTNNSYYD